MDIFTLNYGILDGITVVLLHCKNKKGSKQSLILKYNKLWKTQLMQKCFAHD